MAASTPVSSHVRPQGLVKEIAKRLGHLDEDVYARMDAIARRAVEEVLLAKDKMIGSTVIALAKEIYTMDARFIFELLQNADDNHFERATSSGESPYVLFSVYQDRIVVDCNEDGFTEANLRAICTVGESSKLGDQGYIGEKGIGFKSVFKVAWKVSIQSGDFSFRFKHRPGDSGMGMISPEWWEPTEELVGPLTRITLYLHDTGGDADARAEQRKNINEQFSDLKPEMLLFLKQLKKIEVRFFDGAGNQTSASILSANPGGAVHQAVLKTTKITSGGGTTSLKQNYHVTKMTAENLAPKDNRNYSAKEQATQAYATAEIVLAFPLSSLHVPIIEPQKLFAFLPIREVGFNFLIHSDFATTANREDIVTSSRRNKDLCRHLASAFVIAIRQMCQHPQLRFQWMRYLPSLSGSPSNDPFWKVFIDMLKADMINTELMMPRVGVQLRPMMRLRIITEDFKDEQGEPLFDDLLGQDAIYHSNMYMPGDLKKLQGYGLKQMRMEDVLDRLEADLRSPNSKWNSAETNSDWYSRTAKLLLRCFSSQQTNLVSRLEGLAILLLTSGCWMSANGDGGAVYLPTTVEGYSIPDALGLNLIDTAAAMHTDRRQLYLKLGVINASSEDIRSLVLGFYQKEWCRDLQSSVRMIQSLYLTHKSTQSYGVVDIISSQPNSKNVMPRLNDVYFIDVDAEYGPAKLGLHVWFVDPTYLSNPPVQPDGKTVDQAAWRNWLHDVIGIRRRLRLVSSAHPVSAPTEISLSKEVLKVAEDSPPQFVGLLKSLWPHEGSKVTGNRHLLGKLREVEVICEGGRMVPLSETILPLAGLKQVCSRFLEDGEDLPFLKLVPAIIPDAVRGWGFVDSLGVISQDGLHFYLAMIKAIAAACFSNDTTRRPERIMRLYVSIYAKYIASVSREGARDAVRDTFARFNTVFIPAPRTGTPNVEWYPLGGPYLLNAPPGMRHKHPIDSLYRETFPDDESNLQTITLFFTDTLGIPECSWRDFVEELRYLEHQKCTEMEHIQDQFRFLEEQTAEADIKLLSVLLGEEALVYAPGGLFPRVWHTTKDCIWSTATSVRGKVNLAKHYDSTLEKFFVHALGVQKLNIHMIYDELFGLTPWETVDEAKQQLWSLNSLLRTEALSENRGPLTLLRKAILPVRYADGEVARRSSSVEFAIIDNKALEEKFCRHVNTLDFDMREVRTLQPFLEWSGLENRYLSRMVKEIPNLSSGVRVPVSDKRFDINRKAYALVRVACHFHSPRFRDDGAELYNILQHSETWETDGISSELSLTIDGQTVTARVEQGDVYIDDKPESRLKIYIPHDEETQDVCIQHTLPEKLAAWLMTTSGAEPPRFVDKAAVGVIKGILNARLASVTRILEKDGIVEIDLPAPKLGDDDIQALAPVSAPMVPRTPGRSPSAVSVVSTEISHLEASSNSHGSRSEAETPFTDPLPVRTPGSGTAFAAGGYFGGEQTSPLPRVSNVELYRELLSLVIRASRNRELLGQGATGLYNMSGLRMALTGEEAVSVPTPRQFSSAGFSTFDIGAAGELFVFELLSKSPHLPGFSDRNWTSTIKKLVRVHPDYESTEPWVGREEADLEYEDTAGDFTRLLITKGYLPSEWLAKKPKYYFEVKSTPSTCREPFYMSGIQYKKMKRLSTADTVYIIFRVFNLYSEDIDVKLYVDPLKLERQGQLQFATEKFTVTATY